MAALVLAVNQWKAFHYVTCIACFVPRWLIFISLPLAISFLCFQFFVLKSVADEQVNFHEFMVSGSTYKPEGDT